MPRVTRMTTLTCGVLAILGFLALASCRTEPACKPAGAPEAAKPSVEKPEANVPAGWKLRFTDRFERTDLGPDWKVVDGTWSIENGMLSGLGTIMCTRKFPGAQRLEYDAISDNPGDLSAIICANETGIPAGYFFGFGSESNSHSKLLDQGMEVKEYDAVITPGKLHHVVCERDGTTLKHVVDGKVILDYTDATPLVGEGHDMVGFYIFSGGKIGNVKVLTKSEK